MITILFFASLRDLLECEKMTLNIDSPVSVANVIEHLKNTQAEWAKAFNKTKVLCAVNQSIVNFEYVVSDGDEVAFFPPVTGG
jgi:molybdopterin synthase sulfur carrier subunit